MATKKKDEIEINWGNILENQLERWRGGGQHGRGIGEYITNSDDSYRRLKKFKGQVINVEILSKRGRHIDKLIVKDYAEGMSYRDLEDKFFKYFESASGRDKGESVTGRFGTGGKAYAIMNFKHCWITSIKDGIENKAWFKWDPDRKRIIRGYDEGGFKNKKTNNTNGTIIELQDSFKVNPELMELVAGLEKLPRIRHVLKNQIVDVRLCKKKEDQTLPLKYNEPPFPIMKSWDFEAPHDLRDGKPDKPSLRLQYFQKPLGDDAFIDLTDGISSVADLRVDSFDGRPFSKYFNGSLILHKLRDSTAVKENRKGLEEGDDLTCLIEKFIKESVSKAVSEVEEEQRRKEKERRLNASNEKMKELSRFLKKCDLKFKLELKELKKRAIVNTNEAIIEDEEEDDIEIYRRPTPEDPAQLLIRGKWISQPGSFGGNGKNRMGMPRFIPDAKGDEYAVKIGASKSSTGQGKKSKESLHVLLSDDINYPESDRPVFSEYDDPVSDRDMVTKGVIWINANHPLISNRREKSDKDPVFLEMVANYTLMVVSQYQAQKQYDAEPEDEKTDPILLFRQKFFQLQRDLREDDEISYFEQEDDLENQIAQDAVLV